MNRLSRTVLLLAAAGLLVSAAPTRASEKLAADTGLKCTSCHDKPGSKLLTDRGKFFEMRRSIEGFDAIRSSFGRCTSCHARTPGSARLTKKGRQMSEMVKDMAELQQWLKENHPPSK
jgi:cytochrome c553